MYHSSILISLVFYIIQVNSLQAEIELMNDNYNRLLSDNNSLEKEIADARKDLKAYRSKQKETKAEEMADSKVSDW